MAKKKTANTNAPTSTRIKWTRLPGAGLTGWLRFEGGRWRTDADGPARTNEGALATPETDEIV
jgi:hypothetical protein